MMILWFWNKSDLSEEVFITLSFMVTKLCISIITTSQLIQSQHLPCLSFKHKLLFKASEQECERQKPSHIVTSQALAACSQKSYCPSFKRTPLFNFQALNESTQSKVLHHFPLCVFSHGIGIHHVSAPAKTYPATSLLHYSIWWSNTNVNISGRASKRWITV